MIDFEAERGAMVRGQILARGVTDPRVLRAMESVPREAFVPADSKELAYRDSPLGIGLGQTISQPFIVAMMIEAAEVGPSDRVLEVGAGSGYAAAVLGQIVREVFAVERHEELARRAQETLRALGYDNIQIEHGDGSRGLPDRAPFDAIVVSASAPSLPQDLLDQLAIGGRLVIPIETKPQQQELLRLTRKSPDEYAREALGGVIFVPLIGVGGWPEGVDSV